MEFLPGKIISFILHIDTHLLDIVHTYGTLTYAILFGIVFAETGLVVTPFLPGDSLLFASGIIARKGGLNIIAVWLLLVAAAILGDTVNYWIGHFFGEKLIASKLSVIKKEHIDKTNEFYEKHGGKTIILARFVPIVRTFAPFVAGIGKMHYGKFISFNVIGGVVWVTLFVFGGFIFADFPFVEKNFSIVVIAIVLISVLPMVYEIIKSKRAPKTVSTN